MYSVVRDKNNYKWKLPKFYGTSKYTCTLTRPFTTTNSTKWRAPGVKIMDIAVLWDVNIESKSKYREKVDHYKDLAIMLFRLWQKQATIIIPIIVGSLGRVKSSLHKALKDLSIEAECRSYTLQKTAVWPQHIPKSFLSAKLRELTVLRLVDFPIHYSNHAHVLWNFNVIIIIIIIRNYDGDSEAHREACVLHLRLIIRDCLEENEDESNCLWMLSLSSPEMDF